MGSHDEPTKWGLMDRQARSLPERQRSVRLRAQRTLELSDLPPLNRLLPAEVPGAAIAAQGGQVTERNYMTSRPPRAKS